MIVNTELQARLMTNLFKRVEWRGDCLEVVGSNVPLKFRYGQVHARINGRLHCFRASRVVYASVYGWECMEGMDVMHSCDNPPCVNIDHLSAGTRAENIQQAVERGRHRSGWSLA